MAQTSNYGLGKPDPTTTVAEEIERLIANWDQTDAILKALTDAIATKAAANHNQAIGTITGLTEALAGKMAASKTFAVADLTDVSGSVEAALGYVLAKTALGFSFQSAASLLGNHQHGVADIVGLATAIDTKIAALVASSPATLDTLAELATALGNDPNFATTMATQIADAARLTTGMFHDERLPVRLWPYGENNVPSDANNAQKSGGYMCNPATTNTPFSDWWYLKVEASSGGDIGQRFTRHADGAVWMRRFVSGAWTGFTRVYETAAEIQSVPDLWVTSGQAALVAGGEVVLAHSFGTVPSKAEALYVCIAANNGFSVGDVIGPYTNPVYAGAYFGCQVASDATNVRARFSTEYPGPLIINKSTGVIVSGGGTNTHWRLVLRAKK